MILWSEKHLSKTAFINYQLSEDVAVSRAVCIFHLTTHVAVLSGKFFQDKIFVRNICFSSSCPWAKHSQKLLKKKKCELSDFTLINFKYKWLRLQTFSSRKRRKLLQKSLLLFQQCHWIKKHILHGVKYTLQNISFIYIVQ